MTIDDLRRLGFRTVEATIGPEPCWMIHEDFLPLTVGIATGTFCWQWLGRSMPWQPQTPEGVSEMMHGQIPRLWGAMQRAVFGETPHTGFADGWAMMATDIAQGRRA